MQTLQEGEGRISRLYRMALQTNPSRAGELNTKIKMLTNSGASPEAIEALIDRLTTSEQSSAKP